MAMLVITQPAPLVAGRTFLQAMGLKSGEAEADFNTNSTRDPPEPWPVELPSGYVKIIQNSYWTWPIEIVGND